MKQIEKTKSTSTKKITVDKRKVKATSAQLTKDMQKSKVKSTKKKEKKEVKLNFKEFLAHAMYVDRQSEVKLTLLLSQLVTVEKIAKDTKLTALQKYACSMFLISSDKQLHTYQKRNFFCQRVSDLTKFIVHQKAHITLSSQLLEFDYANNCFCSYNQLYNKKAACKNALLIFDVKNVESQNFHSTNQHKQKYNTLLRFSADFLKFCTAHSKDIAKLKKVFAK